MPPAHGAVGCEDRRARRRVARRPVEALRHLCRESGRPDYRHLLRSPLRSKEKAARVEARQSSANATSRFLLIEANVTTRIISNAAASRPAERPRVTKVLHSPRESSNARRRNDVCAPALLADSGPATPRKSPWPNRPVARRASFPSHTTRTRPAVHHRPAARRAPSPARCRATRRPTLRRNLRGRPQALHRLGQRKETQSERRGNEIGSLSPRPASNAALRPSS